MSEQPGQPWGMCAAFGCPLFGTVGSDGLWYCFCHVHKPSSLNGRITAKLRGHLAPVVETTLDLRRCACSFHEKPDLYRAIQRRLIAAGRRDLLFGANGADSSPYRPELLIAREWLARLEGALMAACELRGGDVAAPDAPSLNGPTPAAQFVETARAKLATTPRVLDADEREPGSDDE